MNLGVSLAVISHIEDDETEPLVGHKENDMGPFECDIFERSGRYYEG